MDNHNTDAAECPVECVFCRQEAPSIEWAAANAWAPSYWDGDAEADGPVCPDCQTKQLRLGDDGELELIPA